MKIVFATLLFAATFAAHAQDRSYRPNGCMNEAYQAANKAALALGYASVRSANRTMIAPIQVENGSEYIYTMNAYDSKNYKIENGGIIVTMFSSFSGECSVADIKTESLSR